MAQEAPTESGSVDAAKAAPPEIKVVGSEHLELRRLIMRRKRITRKLKNLPYLEKRMAIEEPKFSMEEMVAHLHERKKALDREIARHGRQPEGTVAPLPPPKTGTVGYYLDRGEMSVEDWLRDQQARVAGDWLRYHPELELQMVTGRAKPKLWHVGTEIEAATDLTFLSRASYEVEMQSYFSGSLGYFAGAWLYDHARGAYNDDADSVAWHDSVFMTLPNPMWDARVNASVSIRCSGSILSEADDHNEIKHYVFVGHSNEDGTYPSSVTFGEEYRLNTIDLSGNIGLPNGNQFDSGWLTVHLGFNLQAGVWGHVWIFPCTELAAQDGTLSTGISWSISDLVYSIVST